MSTMTMTNGRPQRKQLSDQLDRLDSIIDALADGLPGAVAEAAREGTKAAVRDVLLELLSNPEVLALIRAAAGPVAAGPVPTGPTPASPTTAPGATTATPKPSGIARTLGQVTESVTAGVQRVAKFTRSRMKVVTAKVSAAWTRITSASRFVRNNPVIKRAVFVGASVGMMAMLIAATNHTLATTMTGVGAAATAIAIQGGLWLRSAGRRLGLV